MTTIQQILTKKGPLISSELSQILSKKEKIKLNSASQRVARDNDIIHIRGFFKSNQSLCILPEHEKNENLPEILSQALYNHGKKYWFTFNALKLHNGIINKKYLECYTNHPVKPLKTHIPFDDVMKKFVSQEILISHDNEYFFSPRFNTAIVNKQLNTTLEIIKDTIINDFSSMAKNIGLVSYNTGEPFAEFGKFRWAFKGVCPLMSLKTNSKFGFVLADILFGKPFYKNDVAFFTEKLNHILSFKNSSKILPILLVDDIDKEALQYLKSRGIIIGFIKELFGSRYATLLKELLSVLNNAGASLKSEPDRYVELINQLRVYNEGLANNIRGTLFEFVIGHIHGNDARSIDLGKQIIYEGKRHEMDVFSIYSDKVVVCECKALKSRVDDDMAIKWLNVKIPAFRNWLLKQETLKDKNFEFEFWSANDFTLEAENLLKKAVQSASKFKVSYFKGNDLRQRAIKMKNKKLKEVIDNFFINPQV